MTLHRANAEWYTLVRFEGTPTNLTGVAQTRTAVEALDLVERWAAEFPDDTTVLFDENNAPTSAAIVAARLGRTAEPNTIAS